jgi:membrane protein YdbS with pleckstrin-like domain
MSYAEKQLVPGEEVLYRARYHWMIYSRGIAWLIISLALSAASISAARNENLERFSKILLWAGAVFLAIALVELAVRAIRASADEFVITDRRVIHKIGFIRHETRQCPLAKVQDITVDQSVLGRLLGYGSVGIETASEAGQIEFDRISHPEKLRTAIWTHIGTAGVPQTGSTAASPLPEERLARLNELKAKGLVNDAEYAQQRSKILGDL